MWLPFTSRTRRGAASPTTSRSTRVTYGPAAFTSTRASAVAPPSSVSCHTPSARRAPMQRVRVRMSAPRAAASRAFSTTRRASSTQQSEYSKPRVNSGRSGAPAGSVRRSSERVPGRIFRPPRWSYRNRPSPDQPPRPQARMMRQHEAHRPDDVRRGAQQHLALGERLHAPGGTRSAPDSAGRHGSAWWRQTTCRRRGRPARPAAPTVRVPPRRARCRSR